MRYKYTVTFIGLFVVTLTTLFVILVNVANFNVLSLALDKREIVFSLSPQGWAFFTRNPKESQVMLYRIVGNKLSTIHHRHSHYSNIFGLSRSTTKVFSELQLIKSQINDSVYADVKFNYFFDDYRHKVNLNRIRKVTVKNRFWEPRVKPGLYLLVIQEMLPWAWLGSRNSLKMDAKCVKLEIL